MANGKLHSVTLTSLTCARTSDPLGGNDEVYIDCDYLRRLGLLESSNRPSATRPLREPDERR